MRKLKILERNEKKSKAIGLIIILSIIMYLSLKLVSSSTELVLFNHPNFLIFKDYAYAFFVVYIFFVCVVIFFEGRDSASTLAWLLVFIFIPGIGFVFYILFGRNIGKRFRSIKITVMDGSIKKTEEINWKSRNLLNEDTSLSKHLITLLLKNADASISKNNNVEVLANGARTYYKMIKDLKLAKESIHFQFFIIKNDKIGNEFKEILISKAQEGLEVRVIYDSVGCWKLGKKFVNDLKKSGVKIYPFAPVIFPIFSRDLNYRNHRKIVVVDSKIGFIGGLNIGDEYLGKNETLGFWRDTHLRIVGESIHDIQKIFLNDWDKVSKEKITDGKYFPKFEKELGTSRMQIVSSGPDKNWQCIMKAYFMMITKATKRIWINTPYLVPEKSLRMGLITAALSGIDVRIIIPNKPDHFFVYWSSRDSIEELLKAGVRIYTYEKGFIHSKIIIVDSNIATVGTANLDYRSLEINYEINALLYDKEIVKELEQNYLRDLKKSKEIEFETHKKRGYKEKFLEALGRLVSPLQ